jgi:hypothetical protein
MIFYSYVYNIFIDNNNNNKRVLTDIRQSLNSVTTVNKEGVDLQALNIGYISINISSLYLLISLSFILT